MEREKTSKKLGVFDELSNAELLEKAKTAENPRDRMAYALAGLMRYADKIEVK